MDFSYSEEHNDLKNLSSEILTDFSEMERLKKLEAEGPYFDKELWQKLVESGIHCASLPTTLGGMGMDYNAATLVAEVIGRTVVSIPYIPCIVSTALPLLSELSDSEVLSLLQKITSGESIASAALLEPGNENVTRPLSSALEQNGTWVVTGSKHCVPYAGDASTVMVNATMEDSTLWLGLVNTKQEGVELIAQQCTAGEPQFHINFNKAKAHCIAQGDKAKALIEKSQAMTTVAYCAMAVGAADKMTRISGEYTSERKQFGVAIATFQAVAHRLADCYIDTECLKIITAKAASDINNGEYLADSVSMAKIWCSDVLHRISHAAQHVHGGTGIDRDYHLFRYCLWAKQLELSFGHAKIHLAKLADSIENKYLA